MSGMIITSRENKSTETEGVDYVAHGSELKGMCWLAGAG